MSGDACACTVAEALPPSVRCKPAFQAVVRRTSETSGKEGRGTEPLFKLEVSSSKEARRLQNAKFRSKIGGSAPSLHDFVGQDAQGGRHVSQPAGPSAARARPRARRARPPSFRVRMASEQPKGASEILVSMREHRLPVVRTNCYALIFITHLPAKYTKTERKPHCRLRGASCSDYFRIRRLSYLGPGLSLFENSSACREEKP